MIPTATSLSSSLLSKVRYYRKLSQELQAHLAKNPDDWPKFQEAFNLTVNRVYDDIRFSEKENIGKDESKIYKLKRIFEKRYRDYFLYGDYIRWSYKKPFGYSGDFQIIDYIYQNSPRTVGFDRLWDNYFQELAVAKATRERKEDYKKFIVDAVKARNKPGVRIMDLASGPAREIKEILDEDREGLFSDAVFDCYDLDVNAIEYARKLLCGSEKVNFFQKNAIRLALKKDIKQEISGEYDIIYSSGLLDYFDERIAARLVANLKRLLKKNGTMIIANVRDKFSNSSVSWMEWVAEWYLIYRTDKEFKAIFTGGGFSTEDFQIIPQKSKVMQYCLARV
jgi:extracellular factor (EF) 3-hydroxypalmitic acid methyl ester biosynthesis protein